MPTVLHIHGETGFELRCADVLALEIHEPKFQRDYLLKLPSGETFRRRIDFEDDKDYADMIDDPVPRDSRQSYFLQMADLAAYAAFRRLYPPPSRKVQIVPEKMWDELGPARFKAVTRGASPLAIVHKIN